MKLKSLFVAGLLALSVAFTASAQVGITPRTNVFSGTSGITVTNATTLTINSTALPVYKDRGFALLPQFAAVSASVSNVTFNFQVSVDKANWQTTPALSYTYALTGTTPVIAYQLVPKTSVDNIQWLRLASIVNGSTNNVVVTNVVYSVYP